MAINLNLLAAQAQATTAAARAREFEKRMISDTIIGELEALKEGDVFGLVRIMLQSTSVSSLARGIENKLLGSGTFVPAWIRRIGVHACSANGSDEYKPTEGAQVGHGSLADLVEIDKVLSTHTADAAVIFWGGLLEVVKQRKLRRQLHAIGGELLLATALAESIPDWALSQPLTGINGHFGSMLNKWLGLGLEIKELEYFGSQYSAADYVGLDYDGLLTGEEPDAREGSQENDGMDNFTL